MKTSFSHCCKITALFVLLWCCISVGAQTRTIRTQHGKLVYKITNLGDTITVAKEENPNDPIFFTRIVNSNVVGDNLSAGTEINIDLTYYPDDNGSGVCSNLSIQADECLTCLDPDAALLDIFPKTYKGSQQEYIPDDPKGMGYCFSHHTRMSPHHINHTFRVNHDITENQHLFAIEVNYLVWNNKTEIDCYGGYDEVTRYWELVRVNFVDEPLGRENPVDIIPFDVDLFNRLMDYFGLDQHATPEEAATVALISILLSLLLGGGIGAVGGGVGGLAGGTMPPPVDGPGYLPPDQNPYRDVENKYVTRHPDGSVTVKDPVTGESRLYLPDGHGGYDNPLTGGGFRSEADMLDHLAFLDRNRNPLSQDAETAERNRREQHEAWEAQNKRDLERGYSDEMKEYRDWKAEQERRLEREIQKEHQISKLAAKYHVEATEEAVRKALKIDQIQASIESAKQQAEAADNNVWVVGLESTKNVAATSLVLIPLALSGAGTVSVATAAKAKIVQSCFTMSTSVIDKVGDAYVKDKSMLKAAAHGAVIGAVGVAQNYAGEIGGLTAGKLAPNAIDAVRKTVNLGTEAAVVIGGEGFKAGYNEFTESGDPKKILDKTLDGIKDGTKNHLINKTVEVGFNKAKSWASSGKPTVESTRAHADATSKTLTSSKQAATHAQNQLTDAQSRVSATRQNVARSQRQVTAAQGKVDTANKQLSAANSKVTAAQQKLSHAKTPAEANKAQSELYKAQQGAAKAQQNVNRANTELRTAERIDNANKRVAMRAENDLQKAQMGAQKAQSDLKTATAQHDQALRDAHAAEQKAQIDKGVAHVSGNDIVSGKQAIEDHLKNRDSISKEL
ncbi:MAG: hypothetical protein IJS19_08205 [Muribaculaceae bacterium]|nr:hypothetical protein [Muribaculaceae bacterium]